MKKLSSLLLAALLLLSAATGQQRKLSPDLASLVAAERAFARMSVEKGIRESFLAFFADDGINFQPHPVKTREAILKRPAPATRPPITLNWEPAYADVSQAGDLGYTTGPYVLANQSPQKNPPHYGFYFSVWRRPAGGPWKVVIDCGIDTPDHSKLKFVLATAAPVRRKRSAKFDLDRERDALKSLDREFFRAASSGGLTDAFLSYLGEQARLHRDGYFPFLGRDAIRSFLAPKPMEMTGHPIYADVSASNDLGYTYGSYELKNVGSGGEAEKGYYVRVWKRNKDGVWKIALDTLTTVPPEKQ